MIHIVTGEKWGEGIGSCNSREAKYLNQAVHKLCPDCKAPAIIRSKFEPGWYCYDKKGGCGAKFGPEDPAIIQQMGQLVTGRAWDHHNSILKIGCKRSRVACVLNATAASDIFTQDLEDFEELEPGVAISTGSRQQQQAGAQQSAGQPVQGRAQPQAKKVSPTQIKDLNIALSELEVPADDRVNWSAHHLGRAVGTMQELTAEEGTSLLRLAREQITGGADGGEQKGQG